MKQRYILLLVLLVTLTGLQANAQAPVEYIANKGQWRGAFAYKAITGQGDVYLARNSFTYVVGAPANDGRMMAYEHGLVANKPILDFHAYRVSFVGSNAGDIAGSKPQSWYYNYFHGSDSSKWKTGIHPCLALDYPQLYNGIDMHVTSDKGNIEYDFIVQPKANPAQIKLGIEGAEGLTVKDGNLFIHTSVGDVEELKPYAYQYTDDGRQQVICRYAVKGNTISYDFPNGYDKSHPLIIDPTVVFCTFTGSTADNWGFTATYDDAGNFYAGGLVNGTGYPYSTGAFQTTFGGGFGNGSGNDSTHGSDYASDIGIIKFNAAGNAKIYATYLGGSDNEQPHSLIVDGNNNLIIAGRTYSTDYPVTTGCFDATHNGGADIIVTKLNATATALLGSTYIGGAGDDGVNFNALEVVSGHLKHNYGDDARSEVLIDKSNNIYVTASTRSADFPVTANAYQPALAGEQDAVVFKLDPTASTLLWSTYLGGTGDDAGYVLGLDTQQAHVYVGGGTMSTDFPTAGGATWQPTYQGGAADGYIAKFQNSGNYALQLLTHVGTSNEDQLYGLQVDLQNNVYGMGQSLGGLFPVTAGVYSNPLSSQFIIKLDSNLTTDVLSTVYGSGDPAHTNISPVAFLVDTCENIYISGWGGNLGFGTAYPASIGNTNGMPITANAAQATTDGNDFYFIVLSKNAASLLYGTYYGRNDPTPIHGEHVDGGTSRFDKSGVVYQAICAGCGGSSGVPFPTTQDAYATVDGSFNCNEAALKINFDLGAPIAKAAPDTTICGPFTIQLRNTSANAQSYLWIYTDGSPNDTATQPTHSFTTPGAHTVTLVAYNSISCRVTDTMRITLTVDTNTIAAGFTAKVIDSCTTYTAGFTNTSTYSHTPGAPGFTSFTWKFGDGTTYTGTTPPAHNYPDTGTYTITLIMRDSTACNSPDTVMQTIHISSFRITAGVNPVPDVCLGVPTSFSSISSGNVTSYYWNFGDGQTATTASAIHSYTTAGTYTVTFVVGNPLACNGTDTFTETVTVYPIPVANFTWGPNPPVPNTAIQFTNTSQGADTYVWSFGDGGGSTDINPSHFYKKTADWNVCLTARTTHGCADTVCKTVHSDVLTKADVPTAFSPNGDGSNDIFFVRGGAIETMDIKIFNRWGQLVFESNSLEKGWDGTYNGKPQEMDAYAYVLNVTFIDGTTLQKKGNVTLLR